MFDEVPGARQDVLQEDGDGVATERSQRTPQTTRRASHWYGTARAQNEKHAHY